MPVKLVNAHRELNRVVDLCFSKKTFENEIQRMEFLLGSYVEYICL